MSDRDAEPARPDDIRATIARRTRKRDRMDTDRSETLTAGIDVTFPEYLSPPAEPLGGSCAAGWSPRRRAAYANRAPSRWPPPTPGAAPRCGPSS